MPRYAIKITGKVQGVYFRKYTQWQAEELGLVGFVRNEEDGSVLIEAQGTPEQLDAMIKWCHRGSPLSKVETVEETEITEGSDATFVMVK